jgi:hypothetical protein
MAEHREWDSTDEFLHNLMTISMWSLALGPLMLVWQAIVWLRTGNWLDWSVGWAFDSVGLDLSGWVGLYRLLNGIPSAIPVFFLSMGFVFSVLRAAETVESRRRAKKLPQNSNCDTPQT